MRRFKDLSTANQLLGHCKVWSGVVIVTLQGLLHNMHIAYSNGLQPGVCDFSCGHRGIVGGLQNLSANP